MLSRLCNNPPQYDTTVWKALHYICALLWFSMYYYFLPWHKNQYKTFVALHVWRHRAVVLWRLSFVCCHLVYYVFLRWHTNQYKRCVSLHSWKCSSVLFADWVVYIAVVCVTNSYDTIRIDAKSVPLHIWKHHAVFFADWIVSISAAQYGGITAWYLPRCCQFEVSCPLLPLTFAFN